MQTTINKYYKVILAIIICIFFANYFFVFWGVYENDDVAYMRLSHQLATTNHIKIDSTNHFEHRWLLIFATAFFYKIFGVNDYSSSIFCLLSCLLTCIAVTKFLKGQQRIIFLTTIILFLFNRAIVFHSHRTLADAPLMLLITCNLFVYFNVLCNQKKQLLFGLFSGILFFFCIITKESILILLPFWFVLFIKDTYKKQLIKFWCSTILCFVILTFLYLTIYKINTGNYWFRIEVLFKNNVLNPCSYDLLPNINTVERITIGLLDSFTHGSYMLLYVPAFCAFIYNKKLFVNNPKLLLLSRMFCGMLICSNFMTISYKSYIPLCPDSRHFIFLIPIAAILASFMLVEYFNNPKKYKWLVVLFAFFGLRMIFISEGFLKFLYFPVLCILLVHLFSKSFKTISKLNSLFLITFLVFYALIPLQSFLKKPYPFYSSQKQIIDNLLSLKTPTVLFCNNVETLDNCDYMYRFLPRNITTKLLIDRNETAKQEQGFYFLFNTNGNENLNTQFDYLSNHFNPIYSKNKVALFKIESQSQLDSFFVASEKK